MRILQRHNICHRSNRGTVEYTEAPVYLQTLRENLPRLLDPDLPHYGSMHARLRVWLALFSRSLSGPNFYAGLTDPE